MKTKDGLHVYDLDPNASELWAVAGPEGYDVSQIDPDNLPPGFRWVTEDEWEALQNERKLVADTCNALNALDDDPESGHAQADEQLVAFVREIGYSDVAEAYEQARRRVGFWYA